MSKNVKVFFRNHGCLFQAVIAPLDQLPFVPSPAYEGKVPDGTIEAAGLTPIFLCTKAKGDVRECLQRQGVNFDAYVTPATVHGTWKLRKHQGVIYAVEKDLTHQVNPHKPFPSRAEIADLFMRLLATLLP